MNLLYNSTKIKIILINNVEGWHTSDHLTSMSPDIVCAAALASHPPPSASSSFLSYYHNNQDNIHAHFRCTSDSAKSSGSTGYERPFAYATGVDSLSGYFFFWRHAFRRVGWRPGPQLGCYDAWYPSSNQFRVCSIARHCHIQVVWPAGRATDSLTNNKESFTNFRASLPEEVAYEEAQFIRPQRPGSQITGSKSSKIKTIKSINSHQALT